VVVWVACSGSIEAELELVGTSPPVFKIVKATDSSPAFLQVMAGVNPWGLDCHPDTGWIYFSDPTAGLIGSIDPSAPSPVVTPIVNRPTGALHGIALDAPNNRLFFLDSADDSINVVDLASLGQTRLIDGRGITRPNDLVYDSGRNWIIFTDSGGDFIGITDDAGNIVNGFLFPETVGAWGLALHPQTNEIFFSSFDNGTIHILDPVSATVTPVASGLDGPRGLEFDRFGRLFCLESGEDRVVQIDFWSGGPAKPLFENAVNGRAFVIYDGDDKDGDFLLDDWERRFVPSVLDLDAGSDPENDGRSAIDELLFNGSPEVAGGPAPVRSFEILPGGEVSVVFEGPAKGYGFEVWLSSDLQNWELSGDPLVGTPFGDPLFRSWQSTTDPAALGLDPGRVFVRITGSVEGP